MRTTAVRTYELELLPALMTYWYTLMQRATQIYVATLKTKKYFKMYLYLVRAACAKPLVPYWDFSHDSRYPAFALLSCGPPGRVRLVRQVHVKYIT